MGKPGARQQARTKVPMVPAQRACGLCANQHSPVLAGHQVGMLAMDWSSKEKGPASAPGLLNGLGWLMGLEPTTTGITILDSTN
jgi:hypothetical protein